MSFPTSSTGSPWLHVKHINDAVVLTFARPDIWDEDAVRLAGAEMFNVVDRLGGRRFVLHLDGVRNLSSAMLGKVIAFHRKVKQAGGQLTLCSPSADLSARLQSMRLDKLFHVSPTEEEALGAVPVGAA